MAIGIDYFQPESFEQANPVLMGMAMGKQLQQQALANQAQAYKNQVMPQSLQAALQNQLLKNTQLGIQNQYMPQDYQTQFALRQAQANAQNALPGLYGAEANAANANAGLTGERTNVLRQQAPFLIQQEQAKLFSDPILQRLYEANVAQKTGAIPASSLNALGLGSLSNDTNNAAPTSSVPDFQTRLQNALFPSNGTTTTPLTTPNVFSGNTAQNWALFGSPLSPIDQMKLNAMGDQMKTDATTGVTQYNTEQADAEKSADLANQINNLLNQFQNNYKKTDLTGPVGGRLPAVTTESQATDNASQNIAAAVAKLIAGGRVTNYEMQYINNLKPNRTMTPQAAQMLSDFLKQKDERMQEEVGFLNAARNAGVPVQTAKTLWTQYNNQRPVYDFEANKANTQYQNTWKDYLNPLAIQAAQTGAQYKNINGQPFIKVNGKWYSQ